MTATAVSPFVLSHFAQVGMQAGVETSPLLLHRAKVIVPERMKEMEEAVKARDFNKFGVLTMRVRLGQFLNRP